MSHKQPANTRQPVQAADASFYRFMVEHSPDMFLLLDGEGYLRYASPRTLQSLGRPCLQGLHYSELVLPAYQSQANKLVTLGFQGLAANKRVELRFHADLSHYDASSHGDPEPGLPVELCVVGPYQDEALGAGLCLMARDITSRLESERLIHYQAYHDLLTGLPNRALVLDRLGVAISNARRRQQKFSLMFLDLDRFKLVNDSLGHGVGDKLLQQVAARLKSNLREGDTLARIGGDEFIVMLPGVESREVAALVANKMVHAFQAPFMVDEHEIYVTTSIGVSLYPEDGDDAETLIKHSDIAMYHAKDEGKNNFSLFEGEMSVRREQALGLENEIRRGIKEGQFVVYYQPQVSVLSGETLGMEALLRWQHPERGLLGPGSFIQVAEEAGLMVELGHWVLQRALSDARAWQLAGSELGKLAVNFSARQIEQKDFVPRILKALQHYGFKPTSLEIEITESTLIGDPQNIIEKLQALTALGITVAIDDFGTGYSSLSLLQQLPIRCLKIDRSLISSIQDESSDISIIEAIVHLARGLKLDVVAEGVELEVQMGLLRRLQCSAVQGYMFSDARPANEAPCLLPRPQLQ